MSAQCATEIVSAYNTKAEPAILTDRKPDRPSRHVCEYCLKVFSTSMNLKTHKYQHTGDRPYCCTVCDYAATNLTNFQNHMRAKHTKERPYRCVHCDKCFTEYKTWRTHEDTHTTTQLYTCSLCDRAYKHRTTLLGHVRRKHRPAKAPSASDDQVDVRDNDNGGGDSGGGGGGGGSHTPEPVPRSRKVVAPRKLTTSRVKAAARQGAFRGPKDTEQASPLTSGTTTTATVGSAAFDGTHGEESVDTDLLLGTLPEFTESEQNELLALMRHDSGDQGSIDVALPMLDQAVKIETMVDAGGPTAWFQQNASPSCTSGCLLPTPAGSPKPDKTVVIYPTGLDAGTGLGDWLLLVPVTAGPARPVTILNSLAPPP